MRSSRTISLFSDRPDSSQQSSSIAVSLVVHVVGISLLFLGILYPPRLTNTIPTERYTLRHLDLNVPLSRMRRSAASDVNYPGPQAAAHTPSPGGNPKQQQAVLQQTVPAPPGLQTLIQLKVHTDIKLPHETPTVVLWKPEVTPVKAIVPPPPEKPVLAEMKPMLQSPNHETRFADVNIAATDLATKNIPILPSTTSPIVVHGPELPKQAPATTSTAAAPPTPTAVLSLSDVHMANGTVFLPPANQSVASNSPGTLTQGQGKESSQPGKGNSASKAGGVGSGVAAGDSKNQASPAGGNGNHGGTKAGQDQSTGSGSGTGDQPSTQLITVAKEGQFGSIVVNASLEDRYPEASGMWSGRLAYTVYLHVGLSKSWILQFSAPRSADAAETGNMGHLEAPWPYNMMRPNLAPGELNADALMVHGFVNSSGRFEGLAIVFPPSFPQRKFVLDALQQWQFRPATLNGQVTKVEVLLIIPDIPE